MNRTATYAFAALWQEWITTRSIAGIHDVFRPARSELSNFIDSLEEDVARSIIEDALRTLDGMFLETNR